MPQSCPREPDDERQAEGPSPRLQGRRIQRAQDGPHHVSMHQQEPRRHCSARARRYSRAAQDSAQGASVQASETAVKES
eukprot:281967-Pyramimonas_sp.AAC.1